MKKPRGMSGSAKFIQEDWANVPCFSMNDLSYLWSRKEHVEKYYNFLLKIGKWRKSETHTISFKRLCQEYNVNFKITKALKNLDYFEEVNYLKMDIEASIYVAIQIVLELRKIEKKENLEI